MPEIHLSVKKYLENNSWYQAKLVKLQVYLNYFLKNYQKYLGKHNKNYLANNLYQGETDQIYNWYI